MKIGNIVSKVGVNVSDDFNVVKSLDEIIQGLPTLIMGWDFIKKNYPTYDIFNRQLTPDLFWTFNKAEKRDSHEEDIASFTHHCYKTLIKNVKYIFVDLIHFSAKKMKKVVRKILSAKEITSYIYDDRGYIYCDDIIFGLDFKLFKYMGLDHTKICDKIKAHSNNFLIGNEILIEYKRHIDKLGGQVRYVPFLYSVNHD